MSAGEGIAFMSAREQVRRLRARDLSAREVMTAHLAQIARVNPMVNAIVTRLPDETCLALADAADGQAVQGRFTGPLHGLPIAFKDLEAAVGFPHTQGSPVFRDLMPAEDSVLVARLRSAGALPIGKTNVPELGMGSHTFNKVYGTTLNPYDVRKSAGGSSGGAAVALATGMLSIADGSDLGGSLRNPASFNNVVGFRPTVGLVPTAPEALPFLGFGVKGPMARSVEDVAFLLSVMAGADARDPACVPSNPQRFLQPLGRDVRGVRVAWCPDLGGLPLDPRTRAVLDSCRTTLVELGCLVEDASPDLTAAESIFLTLRRWRSGILYDRLLEGHRRMLKPEAVEEIERGRALTSTEVARAMVDHGVLLDRVRRFEERYEFTVCTVSQLPPFEAALDWPGEVAGMVMEHYLAWMRSAYWISATFRPAVSVPAGFTGDGLPVGLQIVGRHRDDLGVLQMAYAFEQATNVGRRRPAMALGEAPSERR